MAWARSANVTERELRLAEVGERAPSACERDFELSESIRERRISGAWLSPTSWLRSCST